MEVENKRQRRQRNLKRRRNKIIFITVFSIIIMMAAAAGIFLGVNKMLTETHMYVPPQLPLEQESTVPEETEEEMEVMRTTEIPLSLQVIIPGLTETGEAVTSEEESECETQTQEELTELHTADMVPETQEAGEQTPETKVIEVVDVSVESLKDPVYVKLVAVGDNLMHRSVSMSGLRADGSYNYDYNFSKVAPIIKEADLAVINQETVIGGNELGIQGYPTFNGRTEMADALVRNGFDVVLGANNHILDHGAGAVLHMVNYFQTHYPQITLLGIHGSWETRDEVKVVDCKGIRIAMINYTDLLNIPSQWYGQEYLTDYLEYERIAALIQKAKSMSDFVIVFPHWGTEYNLGIDAKQQEQVAFLAQQGVDLVIGSHPHVVEPVDYVMRPDGKKMLVYYSLGNYQSIQNKESMMIGGMAEVELCMTYAGVTISDFNMRFLANDYRMSGGFRDYYDIVTTYPWEQYTRELAETSWVHHDNPAFNVDLMFQLQAQMQAQVTAERQEAGLE